MLKQPRPTRKQTHKPPQHTPRAYNGPGVRSRSYLKDVLDQILAGCTDWESLRADRWKRQHPEAVPTYRVEERRDFVECRRARRRLPATNLQ